MESLGRKDGVKAKRAMVVARHYLAIRTAWCLRYGDPRVRGPRNNKRYGRFIGFVTSLIREGPRALKDFSHETRLHALISQTDDKAARREFLASTVGRSVGWIVSKDELDSAERSTVEAWGKKRNVANVYRRLQIYIDQLPLAPFDDGEIPEWPIPTDAACLSHSTREGGTMQALVELTTRVKLERLDFLFTGIQQPTYKEALTGVFPAEAVEDLFIDFDDVADITEGIGSLPDPLIAVQEYLERTEPALRPLPICEMGGKVRVVTLHPAEETFVARRITSIWLRRLRNCVTSRAMLRNQEVVLERQSVDSKIYSADLHKATDYIDHDLARNLARMLCVKLHRHGDIPIVEKLFGPKMLPSGVATQSGTHMGLGPSWVLLSLLNGFAAWQAGARKDTYHVCGDDLVGYWPRDIVNDYEATLEDLGLVVNKQKSFYGRRGVFCERVVENRGYTGVARDVGHLSALTAAKLYSRVSNNALAVADALRDDRSLPAVSDPVRRRLVPRGMGPGRVRHGGSGEGHLTNDGLAYVLKRGVNLTMSDPLPEGAMEEVRKEASDTQKGGCPISEFLITFRTALQARAYMDRKTLTRPLTKEEFMVAGRANKRRHQRYDNSLLLALALSSSLNSRVKKTITGLLGGRIKSSQSRVRARLENLFSQPPREEYISLDAASRIILTYTSLNFESRLKRAARVPNHRFTPAPSAPCIHVVRREAKTPAL
jgi:hypothetical protein